MKRTILAVALAVIFVMALAVPTFAQMTHTKTVEADGVYDWELQAGHLCNTGGELKQTIMGSGELSKVMTTAQIPGRLTVSDVNDFIAGETALTVTSVIELCAPPKYTYTDTVEDVYHYPSDGLRDITMTAPVSLPTMYLADGWQVPAKWVGIPGFPLGDGFPEEDVFLDGFTGVNMENWAAMMGWDAVSDQIWAAQVQADPGFSGNLHQDFVAAEGPYSGDYYGAAETMGKGDHDKWAWQDSADTEFGTLLGKNYVGSYFEIDQMARTSMGEVKRFIDISSPWSHAYVYQDMSAVGQSEIQEAFAMNNLAAGGDIVGLWYDLF